MFFANETHQKDMVKMAVDCAKEVGYDLTECPYSYSPLPAFETPAEI